MTDPSPDLDDLRRKYDLFTRVCTVSESQRRAFLEQQAPNDPELVAAILAMLAPEAGGLTAHIRDIVEAWRSKPEAVIHPDTIGPYRVIDVLGEGGMGTVYAAVQLEPVERVVAIKVIRDGSGDLDHLARFEREGQALAMMQHDRIAKVYAAGVTPDQHPYLVMELVAGQPLTDWCRRTRARIPDRVRLVYWLCDAVEHMHRVGLVHRDLKPHNVLATAHQPRIKLVDFGLAKPTDTPLPRANFHTRDPAKLRGTPGYMAPEQARGDTIVDTRADVYAIGAILFELLTGETPIPHEVMSSLPPHELVDLLTRPTTSRPSRRVTRSAERQAELALECRTSGSGLVRSLRTDLDWIVLRALEVEPDRRYGSVGELAADLRRHLSNQPVEARPPSWRYQLAKVYRRNRVKFLTTSLFAAAALVAATIMTALALGWSRTIADFDQLSSILAVRQASGRTAKPGFARELPDNVEAMTRWQTEAIDLLAQRPEFEQLANRSTSDEPTTGAERLLRSEISSLLTGLDQISAEHERVTRRLAFARQLARATRDHKSARVSWDEVRADLSRVGSPYSASEITLRDVDVIGLIPLGRNPQTGLWEFYHLRSAWNGITEPTEIPIPTLDENGDLTVRAETGVVLVLLPRHLSRGNIKIEPFFIARHELTRAQWLRLGGSNTFWHDTDAVRPDAIGTMATLPAEQIDWRAANQILSNHGLCLPTEVQWHHAAGCGATSRFWFGSDVAGLSGRANLRDARSKEVLGEDRGPTEPYWDGFARLAPVDALAANRFGLHHVHGNVMEWCRDRITWSESIKPRHGDGLRVPPGGAPDNSRVVRGGGYASSAVEAFLQHRGALPETHRYHTVGVRVARRLRPE